MDVTVQIAGSLLILVPFVLAQSGRLPMDHVVYLALNVAGSTALAIDALLTHQWGFVLLEGVWAIVSIVSVVRKLTGKRTGPAAH